MALLRQLFGSGVEKVRRDPPFSPRHSYFIYSNVNFSKLQLKVDQRSTKVQIRDLTSRRPYQDRTLFRERAKNTPSFYRPPLISCALTVLVLILCLFVATKQVGYN